MARLRRAGHEGTALDGVSPASLGDFGLLPSPLGGEGQGEGSVTALPDAMPPHASMARLRRAGHEGAALDRVSALSPLPLRERVRVRGSVTSLPGDCRPTPQWHGFAVQDARTPSSVGFRRRCAAWRVTFLCVAKEKSPKERPSPLVRPPASGSLGSGKRSGGTTQTVHPCTACVCAVVHDGAPDLVPSPRRTTGGNTQPTAPRPVN